MTWASTKLLFKSCRINSCIALFFTFPSNYLPSQGLHISRAYMRVGGCGVWVGGGTHEESFTKALHSDSAVIAYRGYACIPCIFICIRRVSLLNIKTSSIMQFFNLLCLKIVVVVFNQEVSTNRSGQNLSNFLLGLYGEFVTQQSSALRCHLSQCKDCPLWGHLPWRPMIILLPKGMPSNQLLRKDF